MHQIVKILSLLLLTIILNPVNALPIDLVTQLPGYGKVKQIQYAGYASAVQKSCATIQCEDHPGIFYWFVSANGTDAIHKPIVIWSNGGPGSSSIYGLLLENGPYTVNPDLTLRDQPYSWTQFANYLIIDHPMSAGLSFGDPSQYPKNVSQGTDQYYYALLHFIELHPEYKKNPIFLAGESYAGTYLPLLATQILHENKAHPQNKINLAGMIVSAGWVDPIVQQSMDSSYAYYHGLINGSQKQQVDRIYEKCAKTIRLKTPTVPEANQLCSQVAGTIIKLSGIYDENIELNHGPSDTNLINYLNQPHVRQALHAKTAGVYIDWSRYIDAQYRTGEQDSYLFLYNNLLSKHIPILFFTGLDDEKDSNFLGARAWMEQLSWPQKKQYQNAPTTQWRVNHNLLGYRQQGGGFTWMTVLNAGHLVPVDQPKINGVIEKFLAKNTH